MTPTVSAELADGSLVEMVHRPEEHRTLFCIAKGGSIRYEPVIEAGGDKLVPYSAKNNLLKHDVVLLASDAAEYGSQAELLARIRTFIHRYVDVSPEFEEIASCFVLFTWLYDRFNELPYLRLRGDAGTGKTRFLLTVGSLCYKPIFGSVSIARTLSSAFFQFRVSSDFRTRWPSSVPSTHTGQVHRRYVMDLWGQLFRWRR